MLTWLGQHTSRALDHCALFGWELWVVLSFSTWEVGEEVVPGLAWGCRLGLLSPPSHPVVPTSPWPDAPSFSHVPRASEPCQLYSWDWSCGEESLHKSSLMNVVNNQLEILRPLPHPHSKWKRMTEGIKERQYLICKGFELDLGSDLYICLWDSYPWTITSVTCCQLVKFAVLYKVRTSPTLLKGK